MKTQFEAYWFKVLRDRPEGWEKVTFWKFINVLVRRRCKVRMTLTL